MKCPKNPKSRKFRRILNRGCSGYRDYWGEYECGHRYNWTCEECPFNNVKVKNDLVDVVDVIELAFLFNFK